MGEAACVVQGFSHAPDSANEERKVNPDPILEGSISFGRFMSESLDWGRWSSFCHNRYLEEAEKSSTPGTVAQKKAYFEAHYKRIAAQKAAAVLLEQANVEANNAPVKEADDDGNHNSNHFDRGAVKSEFTESHSEVAIEVVQEAEKPAIETGFIANPPNKSCADEETYDLGKAKMEETDTVIEDQTLVEAPLQIMASEIIGDVENQNKVTEMEPRRTSQQEKPPLQESFAANREISEKKSKVSVSKSSSLNRISKTPPSVKPVTPIHPRKENNSTPSGKKPARDSNYKKRSTSKSFHMSMNLSSYKDYETTPSIIKASPNIEKARDSKTNIRSSKASRDHSSPLITPTRASSKGIPKFASVTPRTTTPSEKTESGSRKLDVKCQSVSVEKKTSSEKTESASRKMDVRCQSVTVDNSCWKFSSGSGNRSCTQFVSSPFSFKCKERAERRKEYFLKFEEKLNTEKLKREAKAKEKAENELKRLRQSLGFKARPMPDFYHKTEPPKNEIKKIPSTRPRSPELGKKTSIVKALVSNYLPSLRPSVKSGGSKHVFGKSNTKPKPSDSPALLPHKKRPETHTSMSKD